jgi:hypothetical protein
MVLCGLALQHQVRPRATVADACVRWWMRADVSADVSAEVQGQPWQMLACGDGCRQM